MPVWKKVVSISVDNTYILGDLNVDMLSKTTNTFELTRCVMNHEFKQIITKTTRITETSKTVKSVTVQIYYHF